MQDFGHRRFCLQFDESLATVSWVIKIKTKTFCISFAFGKISIHSIQRHLIRTLEATRDLFEKNEINFSVQKAMDSIADDQTVASGLSNQKR